VPAVDPDILRWMSQADGTDSKKPKKEKKWKMAINSWLGDRRRTGEWVRESIATTLKRKFTKHTHGKGSTKLKPVIVTVEVEELVYANDGYRPKLDGEKATRKSFYWRGARVWRG